MAQLGQYDIGDRVRVSVRFRDLRGALADPTAVTAKTKTPSGTTTSYVYGTADELVRDDTGRYHLDIDVSASGYWAYRFEGTGDVVAAAEGRFEVDTSEFGS